METQEIGKKLLSAMLVQDETWREALILISQGVHHKDDDKIERGYAMLGLLFCGIGHLLDAYKQEMFARLFSEEGRGLEC